LPLDTSGASAPVVCRARHEPTIGAGHDQGVQSRSMIVYEAQVLLQDGPWPRPVAVSSETAPMPVRYTHDRLYFTASSGRGAIPHRRYVAGHDQGIQSRSM